MIYRVLKQIVSLSLSVFFKKIVVTGKENIPTQGAVIIVANHPNTLIDPLLVASVTEQHLGFVANASIFFNSILNSIFHHFHVIPIFRKKDIAPGEKPDNRAAFLKCHEYLSEGGALLIFPEGSSYYELRLREIKTGTARIALSYESLKSFNGNLTILPVALDYSDSIQFRSMVSITVGDPIKVKPFKELYEQNEFEAVDVLTEAIRAALAKNIPDTTDKEQEGFLIQAHKFYTAYYEPDANLYENPKRSLTLRGELAKALHQLQQHDEALYRDTQAKVHNFFNLLQLENLTTGFFTEKFLSKNRAVVLLGYILEFIVLLPLYVIGLVTNYIPYILPSKIFMLSKLDVEYKASIQLMAGLVMFPIFYALEIWLFQQYSHSGFWIVALLILVFPITGYVTMFYWTEMKRFRRMLHFYFLITAERKKEILKLRNEILENIVLGNKILN